MKPFIFTTIVTDLLLKNVACILLLIQFMEASLEYSLNEAFHSYRFLITIVTDILFKNAASILFLMEASLENSLGWFPK